MKKILVLTIKISGISKCMYKIPFIYTTWNKMFCGKSIENRSSLPSICGIVLDEKLLWNVPKFYVGIWK